MQDLPENHFQVSGASWVNIINYYIIIIIIIYTSEAPNKKTKSWENWTKLWHRWHELWQNWWKLCFQGIKK